MEEYLPLIIQLVSGAVGGNVAGKLLKNMSLGTVGNTIAGLLGGGLGGKILDMFMGGDGAVAEATDAASSMDMTAMLTEVAGGAVGGGGLMAIVGAVKNAMGNKA